MGLLDGIHRAYMATYQPKNGDITAVKAVAGGGKTTALLEFARNNPNKRVLYLAYNSDITADIRKKLTQPNWNVTNVVCATFDATMRGLYLDHSRTQDFVPIQVRTTNLHKFIDLPSTVTRSNVVTTSSFEK